MIAFIANRPTLQVGPYQVNEYDDVWLDDALRRAAERAELGDFPLLDEIRAAVVLYLENQCPLRLLRLDELYAKLRRMLCDVGCPSIAEKLEPVAPPVKLSLVCAARQAGNGFELAMFTMLRGHFGELRAEGAEKVLLTAVRPAILTLRGVKSWTSSCDHLLGDLRHFVSAWNNEQPPAQRRMLVSLEKY